MLEEVFNSLSFQEERALSADLLGGAKPLGEDGAYVDYEKRVAVALMYQNKLQARRLSQTITDGMSAISPQEQAKFSALVAWLGYVSLSEMSAQELERFFQERNIAVILENSDFYNLSDAVRLRLIGEYESDSRDALREKIYNALHGNESTISAKNILGNGRGSIGYWLKEYDAATGGGRAEAFDRVTFENKTEIQKNLTKPEFALLKRLFDFYEWLKRSSDSLAGFEEDTVFDLPNSRYVLTDGVLIDITQNAEASTSTSVPERVSTFPKYGDILVRSRALLQESNGSGAAVAGMLAKFADERDIPAVVATLLLLAQLRVLDDALSYNSKLAELVAADLKKIGMGDSIATMRANSTAPQYVARLLKVILEDRLGLSRADAIAFGGRLAKILAMEGEKYQMIIKDGKWSV